MNAVNHKRTGLKKKIFREVKEYWLIVFYMGFFFAVFTTYRRLILAQYGISYEDYGISVVKALVFAKIVVVVEQLHLGRDFFKDKPLIVPTLLKTVLFVVCTFLFSVIESMIRSFIHDRAAVETIREVMSKFNYEWLASALVVFFFFLPFCALRELRTIMGEGMIGKLFLKSRFAMKPGYDRGQNT